MTSKKYWEQLTKSGKSRRIREFFEKNNQMNANLDDLHLRYYEYLDNKDEEILDNIRRSVNTNARNWNVERIR